MRKIANFFGRAKTDNAPVFVEQSEPKPIRILPPQVVDYGHLLTEQVLLQIAEYARDESLIALRQCSTGFWCVLSQPYEQRRKARREAVWLHSFSRILADIGRDKLLLGVSLRVDCSPCKLFAAEVDHFCLLLQDDKKPLRLSISAFLRDSNNATKHTVRNHLRPLLITHLEDVRLTDLSTGPCHLGMRAEYEKKGCSLDAIMQTFWTLCKCLGAPLGRSYRVENLCPANELAGWLRDQSTRTVLYTQPYCRVINRSLVSKLEDWEDFRLSDAWRTPTEQEIKL